MIDSQTISLILETARIEEVVSDFVSLKKRGTNLIGLCPFHNEKTPSFIVSPAKGIFKCFGCGKGGNSVQFVMEHEQLSYPDALRFLAKKYHIEIQEREISNEEQQQQDDRESMFAVNKFAQEYFSTNLHQHAEGVAVGKSYFLERGFREDVIKKFQLGYCLDNKTAFTQEALKNGYKKEFLERTGLSVFYENGYSDRFRGRVIFPVHTLAGKVVAFGGRILQKDKDKAKYVNSPESDIYHKSEELYGMFFAKNAIVKQNRCFLVEG
jgi:DNA primase